jgi:integrase
MDMYSLQKLMWHADLQVLHSHFQAQQEHNIDGGDSWEDNDLIFPTPNGTSFHQRNILRGFKKTLKDAGLPAIRFHDLRHTAAFLMLNQGCAGDHTLEAFGACAAVDHAGYFYGHLIPGMQREAAKCWKIQSFQLQ